MTAARLLGVWLGGFVAASVYAAQPPGSDSSPAREESAVSASRMEPSELGRLFFTPSQRATLDKMHRTPKPPVATAPPPESAPLPPPPEYVTLNGIVRRSDGATTVWLNNKPVRGRQSEEGLIVAPSSRATASTHVTVRVPQTGRIVDLKVGQHLEVNSGRVAEGYRMPPARPAAGQAEGVEQQRQTSRDSEARREPDRPASDQSGAASRR